MSTVFDYLQHELEALHVALAEMKREISQLRQEKNRIVMLGDCIRVEGNRCELEFYVEDELQPQRSGLVPWLDRASDDFQTYTPPSIGEQGLLLNYGEGDTLLAGVAIFGIRSDANPLPSDNVEQRVIHFANCFTLVAARDSESLTLDSTAKSLTLKLPESVTIEAPDIILKGKLVADDIESKSDIKDAKRSLQQIVDTFNPHTHSSNGAAPPATPIP